MEYKNVTSQAADLDTNSRQVKMVVSETESTDLDNDIIVNTAFQKTLKERGPQGSNSIYFLRDHNSSIANGLITKFSELYMDGNKLVGVATLPKTQTGNDMLTHYEAGNINEHSIGFSTVSAEKGKNGGPRIIKESKMFEASAVLFAAQPNTPTISVGKSGKPFDICKSLDSFEDKHGFANGIFEEFEDLSGEIKAGKYINEPELMNIRFGLLEHMIKRLVLSTWAAEEAPGPEVSGLLDRLGKMNVLFGDARKMAHSTGTIN